MQPHEISFSDSELEYAAKLLLPKRKFFDNERKKFIRDFTTNDLLAVPGSGKTTALIAKLLLMSKRLPFKDGSGVLVLSHTNNAIDEIKEKLLPISPQLFEYPNFVGTIQEFVDRFLCIPFYEMCFEKPIKTIDNDMYEKVWANYSRNFIKGYSNQDQNNAKRVLRSNDTFKNVGWIWVDDTRLTIDTRYRTELDYKKPKVNTKAQNYSDFSDQEKQKISEWINKFKLRVMKHGVLSYEDAYFLANYYIHKYPSQKKAISKRFKFIFVDEMQDMEKHQHEILEKIFYDEESNICFQRIGDMNQAIFSNKVHVDSFWNPRKNPLRLTSSQRLSPRLGILLESFTLHKEKDGSIPQIKGQRKEIDLKPHMIVYDEASKDKVKEKFIELIKKKVEPLLKDGETPKYHAIGWIGKEDEKDLENKKVKISDFFEDYKKEKTKPKKFYETMYDYLCSCRLQDQIDLKPHRDSILSSLAEILNLEGIKHITYKENETFFTKERVASAAKNLFSEDGNEKFTKKIFMWSEILIKREENCEEEVYEEILEYLPEFLGFWGKKLTTASKDFLVKNEPSKIEEQPTEEDKKKENKLNTYISGD